MANWKILINTNDKFGSGTNSNVFLVLNGSKGSSPKYGLDNKGDNFESGNCDEFHRESENIGQLKTILIGHDNSTHAAGWYLNTVEITHKQSGDKTSFTANRWLADDEEDNKCEVELKGSTVAGKKNQKKNQDKNRGSAKGSKPTGSGSPEEEKEMERYWDLMALAKQKHPKFEAKEDKRTVYWVDKQPAGPPTTIGVSARVEELSHPRKFRVKHRPSPEWTVSDRAKSYEATPRLEQLSEHKNMYPGYEHFRPVRQPVSQGAMTASATPRIEDLAKPKTERRAESMVIWDYDYLPQPVSDSAKKAEPSARVVDLSEAKKPYNGFVGERPIRWEVSDETRSAAATTRVQQLARPRSRTMMKDGYDPYKVTFGSLHAVATPRINELCAPLSRKQRSKRVAAAAT